MKRAPLRVYAAALAAAAALALTGCPEKGPAAQIGEKVDKAMDKVSDTLDPKGPAEKAGRSIDRAVSE